ncbi:hypothetical protein BD324DRAFT_611554 [Kockovaella imperatae]|uniref:Secreted protein n=1 Tax=Kockovaella imperatae TaxID=4999 RepID=A0A1Y1URF6_9TREE|nr:hypothetical protein BD324DRAFT_611554 [Kockovaella imperatae]ORX40620.1 hypothetical protein BD324DRAFT_611554 [Kockovaella imperatae]
MSRTGILGLLTLAKPILSQSTLKGQLSCVCGARHRERNSLRCKADKHLAHVLQRMNVKGLVGSHARFTSRGAC